MKNVKNVVFVAVLMLLVVCGSRVNAMSESDLQAKMTKSYDINGTTWKVDGATEALIERYFAENIVTGDDCQYISDRIDEAVGILKSGTAKRVEDLSSRQKEQLKGLATKVTDNTQIKVTVEKGGIVTVYKVNGEQFAKVTKDNVRYTNDNTIPFVMLASSISLIGIVVIARRMKKVNA